MEQSSKSSRDAASNRNAVSKRRASRTKQGSKDEFKLKSMMSETNGGGSPENVEGFDILRAVTSGFEHQVVSGPTLITNQPDGGYFTSSDQSDVFAARKPENVMGQDDRVCVKNTALTPWRCICHLQVEFDYGPPGFGSGFIVGENTILTAAHVLVDRRMHPGGQRVLIRKAREVQVIPGRNGRLAPYGFVVVKRGDLTIPDIWMTENGWSVELEEKCNQQDYATINISHKVGEEPYCKRLGYFGLQVLDEEDERMKMLFVNNAGYPREPGKANGTLWYNAGRIRDRHKDDPKPNPYIEYMIDTVGGQSGSPIYYYDEMAQQRYAVGIHTQGSFINRGLRINKEVFKKLKNRIGRDE